MTSQYKHLDRERRTIEKMVEIYCSDHHGVATDSLCADCYKPAQREQVKVIMRYAGPRMLLRHPVLAIMHKIDGLRMARHPRELTREERLDQEK